VFRQVRASGHCINFHIDQSARTLHVRLNRPGDCDGGRLVFVGPESGALEMATAQATVHDKRLVHGVTRLDRGVRFGLFLIRE
jgi:predicted 2-oxoglutarate/Fe(II)-dependent dioxygenase YbiX